MSKTSGFLILLAALSVSGATLSAQLGSPDPAITRIVDSVSPARIEMLVNKLAAFETRNTLSDTVSQTRGIGAARRWIHQYLTAASSRLQVSYDIFQIPQGGRITKAVELRNVVAILPGRSARRVYVSGHYDTVARPSQAGSSFDWSAGDLPAPGANDDGSGTALVMELASVFARSGVQFDATLVFIAFAGEEQGLIGATAHAKAASEAGLVIEAVLNNDIVGNTLSGSGQTDNRTVRVFSDGPEDSNNRQLARYIRDVAARYVPAQTVRLVARHDRFGRGGDHTPFNQLGYAGVRFSEATENFSRQHTVDDTPDGVWPDYLARNAQVNASAAASLALAPPAPVVISGRGGPTLGRGNSGYDATLRWQESPGAVAYRIVWRDTWSTDWQHSRLVGKVTSAEVPGLSIDDYVFGVAAIGANGHESMVSAYLNPPRR